jgi:hypothetical protein
MGGTNAQLPVGPQVFLSARLPVLLEELNTALAA